MKKIITSNETETILLGEKIGKNLKCGDVVALFGDLGSGKTAFTNGVAKALGTSGVSSPTFNIVNEYVGGKLPLYHFDAYRINSDDWLNCGFDDYMFGDGACIIEWSENITDILPAECIRISISREIETSETIRIFEIDAPEGRLDI